MTAKSKAMQPRSPKPAQSSNNEERIRQRASELYEQRGRVDGFALDDWLQAETEILGAQKQRKVKATKGSKELEASAGCVLRLSRNAACLSSQP